MVCIKLKCFALLDLLYSSSYRKKDTIHAASRELIRYDINESSLREKWYLYIAQEFSF